MDNYDYNRTKTNLRERFSAKDKRIVLSKSNGKCAHCGKPLEVYHTTVEHCIPLSKGGSNSIATNLVALCKECNTDKSNLIVNPKEYYKHLLPLHLEIVNKNYNRYLKETDWFELTNFFPNDYYIIPRYDALIQMNLGILKKYNHHTSLFKNEYEKARKLGCYSLKKYMYDDYWEVIKYNKDIHKKDIHYKEKEFVRDLEFCIKNGAVYLLKKGGKILACYLITMGIVGIDGQMYLCLEIDSTMILKKTDAMITNDYIVEKLTKSLIEDAGFNNVLVKTDITKNDPRNFSLKDKSFMMGYDSQKAKYSYHQLYTLDDHEKLVCKHIKNTNVDDLKVDSPLFNQIKDMSNLTEEELSKLKEEVIQYSEEANKKKYCCDVFTFAKKGVSIISREEYYES